MTINLRKARPEDEKIILQWANDPSTRKMSFHSEKISRVEHSKWFSENLGSSSSLLFIAYEKLSPIGFSPVGLCRFHKREPQTWEFGINLAPEYRYKKLGSAVLMLACKAFWEQFPSCAILARTRPENLPFISIAKKAGFEQIGSSLVNQQTALELIAMPS